MALTIPNKISQDKYAPLCNLFNKNNSKCSIIVGDNFKSFKQVELCTEDGRDFYALQSGGGVFTAYIINKVNHPIYAASYEAVAVYER
jgi:hypothetical protein